MCLDLMLKHLDAELSDHGCAYEVWLGDEFIVKSRDPEFAACRKLAKSGRFGQARFWREGKLCHDIEMDVARAAKCRTKETMKKPPHFVRFEEFPADRLKGQITQCLPAPNNPI